MISNDEGSKLDAIDNFYFYFAKCDGWMIGMIKGVEGSECVEMR